MAGQFQHEFTHEIPVEKKVKEPLWGHPKPLWGHPKPRCNFITIDVGKLIKKQTREKRTNKVIMNGTLRETSKSLCEYRQNTSNRPVYYYLTSLSVLRSHSNPR